MAIRGVYLGDRLIADLTIDTLTYDSDNNVRGINGIPFHISYIKNAQQAENATTAIYPLHQPIQSEVEDVVNLIGRW